MGGNGGGGSTMNLFGVGSGGAGVSDATKKAMDMHEKASGLEAGLEDTARKLANKKAMEQAEARKAQINNKRAQLRGGKEVQVISLTPARKQVRSRI